METNYRNIYEIQPAIDRIQEARAKFHRAELEKKAAIDNFKNSCAKIAEVDINDLIFSDVCCLVRGILKHVHLKKVEARRGSSLNILYLLWLR